jgi:hypothetical protein
MEHWTSYWQQEKHTPIVASPPAILYGGTHHEPLASIGMSCFLDAIKYKFKEGISIIDYGCGAGILSNFISSRLETFSYVGLEPKSQHGQERIALGREYFNDPRILFGFTDDFLNIKDNKVDAIILISVFTHMIFDDIKHVLDNLFQVFMSNPECTIVFSCFISDTAKIVYHQPHIWERFYGESYITLVDLQTYCDEHNVNLEKHTEFIAQGGYIHQIFKINKL